MDNTSLFQFTFVDRREQKKLINDFLENRTESNVLWLSGAHGVGKSFLLNNINSFSKCPKTVYVELKSESLEQNCLLELLKEIEKITNNSFLSFFKENYIEVINVLKSAVVFTIKQIAKIDMEELTNSLFDIAKLYVKKENAKNEQQNAIKLISSYLNKILSNSSLLIVIDNFSLCDKKSLSVIIDIILYYQKKSITDNNLIYFILSTTSNNDNMYVETQIKEKIPNCHSKLIPFEHSEYFYIILNRIFDLPRKTVNDIFMLCQGNPQRLKDFIHKLYDNDGIDLKKGSKPIVNIDKANKIINSGAIDIDFKSLSPSKRIILSLIVLFGKPLTINLLKDMTNFVLSELSFYPQIENKEINIAIYELINDNTIIFYEHNNDTFIKMEHDLKFESIKNQIENEPYILQINKGIFKLLNINGLKYLSDDFNESDLNDSIAFHAYKAQIGNWQTLNVDCGINKYNLGLYENASIIFNRIENFINKLEYSKQIKIADCYFQNGIYIKAQKILRELYQNNINSFSFDDYCLYAQIENILTNHKHSKELADKASSLENITETMRLKAERIKQQSLINLGEKRVDAKEIFDNVTKNVSKNTKTSIEYGNFLISTVEFYRGNKAQNDLREAERIALKHNDQLLLGTIYYNMGFDAFWEGNFKVSKENILKSYDIFNRVRQHESAYSLNNLAAHFMIENEIDRAINSLYKALIWAQTNYAQIVIKTQLMICYAILSDNYCLKLAEEVKQKMYSISFSDISAYIKFYYNLSFACKKIGMKPEANECLYNAIKAARETNSRNLPHTWIKEVNNGVGDWLQSHLPNYEFYKNQGFDPWLLTLNHY